MKLEKNINDFLSDKCRALSDEFREDTLARISEPFEEGGKTIDSPLEQMFFIEWQYRILDNTGEYQIQLYPQYKDKDDTGKYYIDFYVDLVQIALSVSGAHENIQKIKRPLIGIEIDGHKWHEKTKKQVEYHKARDRFLTEKGWRLLRFSGSEVFRDVEECVDESLIYSRQMLIKYLSEIRNNSLGK
jgi:hypothetical protein